MAKVRIRGLNAYTTAPSDSSTLFRVRVLTLRTDAKIIDTDVVPLDLNPNLVEARTVGDNSNEFQDPRDSAEFESKGNAYVNLVK